jgi:hypothetical protein
VSSKPDFVLHVGEEPPMWTDVELLFEHTRSRGQEAVTKKFSQWLRNAWSIFHHQPFRRHLYGIMFIQPYAYICYADHGCAVYSEPLDFVKNDQQTQFLINFLTGFIANPEDRGRDPTVKKEDRVYIRHAETIWAELPNGRLYYRPCLVGRNIRVAQVEEQGNKFLPKTMMVMKSTWEEKLPPVSSPPSEVEILEILEANVRGLPQPYALESAIVRNDDNSEVETRRRLTRILMSYCTPLREAMRNHGPESLMRTIRDAMIVYYETYKLPESGFIHGGKDFTL